MAGKPRVAPYACNERPSYHGVSNAMDRDDRAYTRQQDGTWVDAIENRVGKALEQETTQVTKDDRLPQRMVRDFA